LRIAVVNETSAGDKNKDILNALEGYGHAVINAGMTRSGVHPELTYVETGLIGAVLLNTGRADLVVGGCGTGQGFLNAVLQYPGVFCGLIQEPLDAWLFAQINGGNCISLALNKGYGWAGEVNLKFIFEKFFSVEAGCGYPVHRVESQKKSRLLLNKMSSEYRQPFSKIIERVDAGVLRNTLLFPGITALIDVMSLKAEKIKSAFIKRYDELGIPY
jgi:ribose 5-phosphate isomerase RpiB